MAMVGVIVRPEYRVDLVDRVVEQLLAQVGRGIDKQPRAILAFDQDRDPRAAVLRFPRIAFAPVVADPGNPRRGARTEDDQLHVPAFVNSERKLRVVFPASVSTLSPRRFATKAAVSAT